MKAQFYLDDPVIRIFKNKSNYAILDCMFDEYNPRPKDADLVLDKCHLKRLSKWKKRDWGYETKVQWK